MGLNPVFAFGATPTGMRMCPVDAGEILARQSIGFEKMPNFAAKG
jgi:hypothetical protein